MQITQDTPMETITIAKVQNLSIPAPYTEGHVLTANEAAALNHTLASAIRSRAATEIAKLRDEEVSSDEIQAYLDSVVADFEFGIRLRKPTFDPVEKEMKKIAEQHIKQHLKARHIVIASVPSETKANLVSEYLSKFEKTLRKEAENRLAVVTNTDAADLFDNLENQVQASAA